MHIITAASKTENRISQRAARGKNNARAVSANLRAPDEAARSVFTRSWGEMFQTQTASHSFSLSLSHLPITSQQHMLAFAHSPLRSRDWQAR